MALKNVIDTELAAHRLTEWLSRKVSPSPAPTQRTVPLRQEQRPKAHIGRNGASQNHPLSWVTTTSTPSGIGAMPEP